MIFSLSLLLSSLSLYITSSQALSFGPALPFLFHSSDVQLETGKAALARTAPIKGDEKFLSSLKGFRNLLLPEDEKKIIDRIFFAALQKAEEEDEIRIPDRPEKIVPLPDCGERYSVQGIIANGKGDKNFVLLVEETKRKRKLVWKLFGKEKDFLAEKSFFEEAQAHGGNPNIVRAECVLREGDPSVKAASSGISKKIKNKRRGILLELVEGGQDSLVWSRKRATTTEDLKLASKTLLETLKWIHSIGWIHADLKCGNVMIDGAGRPIIIDFGYSFKRRKGGKMGKGNWSIKAPELNRKLIHPPSIPPPPTYLTEAIDMWAYGSVIASWHGYKYLPTYRPLYGKEESTDRYYVMVKIVYGRDYSMNVVPRDFPTPLRELLYLLVDPDPSKRTFSHPSTYGVLKELAFFN